MSYDVFLSHASSHDPGLRQLDRFFRKEYADTAFETMAYDENGNVLEQVDAAAENVFLRQHLKLYGGQYARSSGRGRTRLVFQLLINHFPAAGTRKFLTRFLC